MKNTSILKLGAHVEYVYTFQFLPLTQDAILQKCMHFKWVGGLHTPCSSDQTDKSSFARSLLHVLF